MKLTNIRGRKSLHVDELPIFGVLVRYHRACMIKCFLIYNSYFMVNHISADRSTSHGISFVNQLVMAIVELY